MSKPDALLQSIIATLRDIDDVPSVWLAGSRGRGTHDEFSDIDIWIAVQDEAIAPIVDDPLAFVHRITPTVMHIPEPAFAPPGGAFVSSWVPVDDAFVQVDWYIAPAGTAKRDENTLVVFGDVDMRTSTDHVGGPDTTSITMAQENLALALRKISDMVKHARRGRFWDVANSARNTDKCLNNARSLLATGAEPTFLAAMDSYLQQPPPATVRDVQVLALTLLDMAEDLATDANADLGAAITAMRTVIFNWRE